MATRYLARDYPPADRGRVVVWGYLASYPFGGMTWQVLHYLAGLRALGFDVWYVEDTDAEVRDPVTLWNSENYQPNVDYLQAQMASIGLPDRWIFRPPGTHDVCLGASDFDGLAVLYRDADAVVNLCGSHELKARHDDIDCLVYLETDPVPKQIAVANGDAGTLAELDRYRYLFTYGENLGSEDCPVPLEVFHWNFTRPPVIVDWWRSKIRPAPDAALSTVTSWTKTLNDVSWQGENWRWSKHLEFRRFRALPEKTSVPLELAVVGMDDSEAAQFEASGWRLRQASTLSDPRIYHDYITQSLGEFTVAKEQYVKPRTGWFSDRSVCFLAAGRPVVTQDTGFSKLLPCGVGLIPFLTEQDALDAIASIAADYKRHCEAAVTIAGDCFSADKVLREMMSTIGLL